MLEISLDRSWEIMQDVHDLGEEFRLYECDFDTTAQGPQFSEWQPLDRLAHLQTVLSSSPYFGREIRHFNQAPWWYRHRFLLPNDSAGKHAVLSFGAVDYYCKVWLNGRFLGSHQGYATPFSFDVSAILKLDKPNLLIVKVWSPWDMDCMDGNNRDRTFTVLRGMAKGTYEHGDTLIQRDVNPVGIWKPVWLTFHEGLRLGGRPRVTCLLQNGGASADVNISLPIQTDRDTRAATMHCRIYSCTTGQSVAEAEQALVIQAGSGTHTVQLSISNPDLWTVWDRGEQPLYQARLEIRENGRVLWHAAERFGIRTVEMTKTEQETAFHLNGRKIFLRGTAYFPDVYLSEMHEARYRRDVELAKGAGFNAIRVHVHTPSEILLDICDELGLAVLQDFDINWAHPVDVEWGRAAAGNFGEMVCMLRNHPSILAWVCTNEPAGGADGALLTTSPGPLLLETAARMDPDRPLIRGSGAWGDTLQSGDTHNYIGSLDGYGTHYTDIFGKAANKWGFTEKLNTEFGMDAPSALEILRKMPRIHERLKPLADKGIEEIQYYQYRLLKYYIEHYRMMKYAPCSGYFQFMFIDLCPQSFYGVYDWWGLPKVGLAALNESNLPIGIFMLYKDKPEALYAANDTLEDFTGCRAAWSVVDGEGILQAGGSVEFNLPADSLVELARLGFSVCDGKNYTVHLTLRDASGRLLAANTYRDAFHHPCHPQGHPHRMSHELGMRLFWA